MKKNSNFLLTEKLSYTIISFVSDAHTCFICVLNYIRASGSEVEYRLAKARVAGSNPVSRLIEKGRKTSKIKLSCFFVSKNNVCRMCATSLYVRGLL